MLPTTSFAALLLIALIPGYAYLRLTEDARRPRAHSALGEFLEVLAVGLGTTGVAAVIIVLLWSGEIAEVIAHPSLHSGDGLRRVVLLCAVLGGLALGIACLGAWLTRLPGKGSYSPHVWQATLGLRGKGLLPYVTLELKNDSATRIEGVLHAYTTLDDDHPRDIALMQPTISRAGQKWRPGPEFVVVSADQIAKVWLDLAPDPGQPSKRPIWQRKREPS
ncbi:DUF6338 family protein [Microbacterium sp.]|uniref:DUF6338 family protein n=1 Tax=Microbacterium sp. TaxID=51671 RepID=UPI002732972D|nr:DUF6338 family protein [Microbacterium sp.]MDP3951407.1 DUF6338 family protein [Microbacterium sp.]